MSAALGSERLALREVLLRTTRLRLEQLEEALRRQQEKGGRLTDAILELGLLKEDELLQALGTQFGMPVHTELSPSEVDTELTARGPGIMSGVTGSMRSVATRVGYSESKKTVTE